MTYNERLGEALVQIFKLKEIREQGEKRYMTAWGTKTLEGLGAIIRRIQDDLNATINKESREEVKRILRKEK